MSASGDIEANEWNPGRRYAWSPGELQQLIALERSGSAFLATRLPGTDEALIFELPGEGKVESVTITIGRGAEVDVDLSADREVSRSHCRLERIGGSWAVSDDGLSRNGTFVNAQRITGTQRLFDRDVIRCGKTNLLFGDPGRGNTTVTSFSGQTIDSRKPSDAQLRVLESLCRPCLGERRFATPATNREIAEELFLSIDTVKSHLRALFSMFELDAAPQNQKRARLVDEAIAAGLVRDVSSGERLEPN